MTGNTHKARGAAAKRLAPLFLSALMLAGLGACDDTFFEYEGDCSATYLVKFRYDYNMKYADAFAHEVESVTLYLVDGDGLVVWKKTERGEALAREGYAMNVDVDPGQYDLLAWCGTKDNGSFIIPDADLAEDLTCTLNCRHGGSDIPYVDSEVDRLYYGYLPDQEFGDEEGAHVYTMYLVKDTNTVRVVLQNIGSQEVDGDMFTFMITADNGQMDWDNSLVGNTELNYYAFNIDRAYADLSGTDSDTKTDTVTKFSTHTNSDIDTKSESITKTGTSTEPDSVTKSGIGTKAVYGGAVAEFTVGRMVWGRKMRLTVLNNETGETVLSIPLQDYAVLVKGYYNREMDNQEYLDRQDEYDFGFFLDNGNHWIDAYVYINSWRIVLQDVGL